MKNGHVPRSASRSEPKQSFQHHGQGHAAFFFFSGPQTRPSLPCRCSLSLTALVLGSQKQRDTQQPVNLTSVPVGSQSIREALDLTRHRGPSSSQSTT